MIPRRFAPLLPLGLLVLAGCATVPRDPVARAAFQANHDPLEPLNRDTFAVNLFLDRTAIKPLAKLYRRVLPERERDALRHFLDNLHEPVIFANTVLQGRFKSASITLGRLLLNSTAGVGGLIDVAKLERYPRQVGDFGQTLWSWGAKDGPYLILPVLGPSNPRDGIGLGFDIYGDPFRYIAKRDNFPTVVSVTRTGSDGIDQRTRNLEALDELQKESVDYYASLRSLFQQHRAAELKGSGAMIPVPSADFYEDPGR